MLICSASSPSWISSSSSISGSIVSSGIRAVDPPTAVELPTQLIHRPSTMTDSSTQQLFEEIIKRLDIMIGRNAELLGRVQDDEAEDHLTDLLNLEQTGKVQTYFDAFELLRSRVVVSEENALEIFLRGLEPAMQKCVRWFGPRDVKGAYLLARLKESTIMVLGVKEDVLLDEIGAETGLKSVLEGSDDELEANVFDEMSKKIIDIDDCIQEDMEQQDAAYATEVIIDDCLHMPKAEKWINIIKERDKDGGLENQAHTTSGLAAALLDFSLYKDGHSWVNDGSSLVQEIRDYEHGLAHFVRCSYGTLSLLSETFEQQPTCNWRDVFSGFTEQHLRRNYKLFMTGTQRARAPSYGYHPMHKGNLRLGVV